MRTLVGRTSEVKVYIDGEQYGLDQVFPLFQYNPYPAGHRYCMAISRKLYDVLFKVIKVESLVQDENRAMQFLGYLSGYLDEVYNGGQTVKFMINSIDKADNVTDTVVIEGVCSPVIKDHDTMNG